MNAFADILEAIAHAPIEKRAMTNHGVLNEAFHYAKPSSFSRGMRIALPRTAPKQFTTCSIDAIQLTCYKFFYAQLNSKLDSAAVRGWPFGDRASPLKPRRQQA